MKLQALATVALLVSSFAVAPPANAEALRCVVGRDGSRVCLDLASGRVQSDRSSDLYCATNPYGQVACLNRDTGHLTYTLQNGSICDQDRQGQQVCSLNEQRQAEANTTPVR